MPLVFIYVLVVCDIRRFNSVFIMEYPDDLNAKNMMMGFISYVDDLLIRCLQVSLIIRCYIIVNGA